MFDLLPVARASALNRLTPILCINGIPGRLTPAALRGIRETVVAMGCEWLDVTKLGDDEAGTALLGQALRAHLPAQPTTPAAGSTATVYAGSVKDEPA